MRRLASGISRLPARTLAVGVAAVAVLVCGLVSHLHFAHEATLRDSVAELQSVRQARAELAKGFLHITLAASPGTPFDRVEGRTLLQQAIDTIEQTVSATGAVDAESAEEFRQSVNDFQAQLDAWERGGETDDPRAAVALRVAFHELERRADAIDSRIQEGLQGVSRRLRTEFAAVLSGAALLLVLIVGLFVLTLRLRERSEEALSASENRWQFALEGAGDGVWDWNIQSSRVFYSARWKAMLGYRNDELSDSLDEWKSRVHPDDLEATLAALEAHRLGASAHYECEYRLRGKDGAYVWVLDRGMVVARDRTGNALRMIGTHTDVTARRETGQRLRDSEERFRRLVEEAPDAIYIQAEGRFVYANRACLALFGAREDELTGAEVLDRVHPDHRAHALDIMERLRRDREAVPTLEIAALRIDGTAVPVEVSAIPFRTGDIDGGLVFLRDIRARKAAEAERDAIQAQFLHAQKMESVGRLAGGIAHDFNNILSVINGYAEMALGEIADDAELRANLQTIHDAGQRAARLTRQLLAFSRKQVLVPQAVDLNAVVTDLEKMFARVIGETIAFRTELAPDLALVKADEGQLEQVIANLVVNARDAMPGGGVLTVATRNVAVTESDNPLIAALRPGAYVSLSVSDTGSGMDEETRAHIFEPFFTTKDIGKGTGLGLAMVYGTVQQSEGAVTVDSEPGKGSTFTIYLPRAAEAAAVPAESIPPVGSARGNETILVVEDEESIRVMAARILERAGYTVLTAANGHEALESAERHADEIHLLFTDMVMPGMNGMELADALIGRRPGVKVLLTSGYSDGTYSGYSGGTFEKGTIEKLISHRLDKPYGVAELLAGVRRLLGGAQSK